ncbi:hypothetical protein KC19_4G214700 [Ceratodon purpureus]|uniref:Uncharacterized protein n=1 Tax=Ceratodon purpureus TaxID=3225 RepID=A0A8T0IDA6_CERPU|nr:hypothetical protein KC19_4G214700 [Ceratodon purpureus]
MFPPLERRVRVCLFDGCKFVGNVHVFPAVTAIEEEDEPWDFVNKGASRCLMQYSSTEELSLFVEVNVRYNSTPGKRIFFNNKLIFSRVIFMNKNVVKVNAPNVACDPIRRHVAHLISLINLSHNF